MAYVITYKYDGSGPYEATIDHAASEQEAIAQLKRRLTKPQLLEVIDIQPT